jgi:hypothetical protein
MEDKEKNQLQTPETPPAVKREIAAEYRELATVMKETAKIVSDASRPGRFFGRWFHTSTS